MARLKVMVDTLLCSWHRDPEFAKARLSVKESVTVSQGGATLTFHPREGDDLVISYLLDYGPQSLDPSAVAELGGSTRPVPTRPVPAAGPTYSNTKPLSCNARASAGI